MTKKQTKPVFARARQDEETIVFFVNGVHVGDATHDDLGWGGMETVDRIFSRIAGALGATVEETEVDDEK